MTLKRRLLVRGERDQRQMARPLDGLLQGALVVGTGTRNPPRQDLRALGNELLEQLDVFVVDVVDLVGAELTDLPPPEEYFSGACQGLDNLLVGSGVDGQRLMVFPRYGRSRALGRLPAGGPLPGLVRAQRQGGAASCGP